MTLPDRDRPQPVLDAAKGAAALTTLVGGALTLLAAFGITVPDPEGVTRAVVAIATALVTLVAAGSTLLAALRARDRVTPLEAPVSADGVPLVTDLPGRHAVDRTPPGGAS